MKKFLKKNIVKVKKVQLNKKNFNSKILPQRKTNNYINKKNIINQNTNNKINNLVSKYNKIITSLNNKINNSEFINNENNLLLLYYNELNEFWNYVIKVN